MSTEKFFKDERIPFAECRYTRGSVRQFKPHMHRTFSIGAVDAGVVEYRVGGATTKLSAGALAVINPETEHACNTLKGARRSYYMLYLDVNWCSRLQQALWGVETFQAATVIRLDERTIYDSYILTMQNLMDDGVHLLDKEQQLHDLMSRVFEEVCRRKGSNNHEISVNMKLLKQKLGSDLNLDISLESLAGDLGLNPYTMLRHFKKQTGLTPHAFRTNCRIERAKQCLRKGMDIADTAYECGFFDQSHLHRHFKAMTTVTPLEYRVNFVQ